MLSKNKIKYLTSLSEKKGRLEHMAFLVEGEKLVLELFDSEFIVQTVLYTSRVKATEIPRLPGIEYIEITEEESVKISSRKTPQGIFAVTTIPNDFYSAEFNPNALTLALHDIQDPGNLGTIIRTADWFGVKQVICSKATADVLNPKVLQSTMGAVFRVKLFYTDLNETLLQIKGKYPDLPVFAAILGGTDLYRLTSTPTRGILMMGNESKGLSDELINLATHRITIPKFGDSASSESLNVSVAAAIILSEFRRKTTAGEAL